MAGSVVVALMLFLHRLLGTWKNKVSVYIALTEFQKQKMSEGGLPADRIFVKPNFVRSETEKEPIECDIPQSPYALFVGRLSPEKGCTVLLQAWKYFLESCDVTQNVIRPELLVVGDGPDKESLEQWSEERQLNRVRFTGKLPRNQVQALMKRAEFLILPSLWYEGFPMTIVEAFSCGTPVLASDLGGMKEIIEEGVTGRKFIVGDVRELAEKMNTMFNSEELVTMRAAVQINLNVTILSRSTCAYYWIYIRRLDAQVDMNFVIITPSYNQVEFLRRCIASIADQVTDEIVIHHHVQDGGSSDGTGEFLKDYAGYMGSIISSGYAFSYDIVSDDGMYDALNKGIEYALNIYLGRLLE